MPPLQYKTITLAKRHKKKTPLFPQAHFKDGFVPLYPATNPSKFLFSLFPVLMTWAE